MGQLTALKIKALKEPGRYADGDGLTLVIAATGRGNWVLRATINGRRREIGLGSLTLVTLAEARAKSLEYRSTEAPMRSLSRGLPRQPRKDGHFAAMPFSEVPDLIASLRERATVGRLALEALILTAARSGEIRGATWSEVDLETGLWSVPAERMKMARPHHVPLAPETIEVFQRANAYKVRCSDLVFPGQKLKTPMSDMTLLKIMRDMETGVTVHGFRSAFRDWVAEETSFPGEVAEAALAHAVSNKVEAAYSGGEMSSHGFRAMASTLLNEMGRWNPDAIERQLAHAETDSVRKAYARGEYWDERVRMMQAGSDYLDELRDGAAAPQALATIIPKGRNKTPPPTRSPRPSYGGRGAAQPG